MAYQQGYETLAQSMNGILSFNDGAGTLIQNGTITTNGLQTNNILAEYTNQVCSLFSNLVVGIKTTIGRYITITDNAIDTSAGDLQLGGSTTSGVVLGKPDGTNYVRSYAIPTSTYDVINYAYLIGTYTHNLLGLTNIWTGVSNTFNNVIYASMIQGISSNTLIVGSSLGSLSLQGKGMAISATPTGDINISAAGGVVAIEGLKIDTTSISPITSTDTVNICRGAGNVLFMGNSTGSTSITGLGTAVDSAGSLYLGTNSTTTAITIGNSAAPTTLIKNSTALIIGKLPETYVVATGLMSAPGIAFQNVSGSCQLGFHSNTLGNTENDARILVQSGAASGAATADMTIQAGTIQLLGTTYCKVGSFTFSTNSLQSTNVSSTVDFFDNGNTVTLNIGNSGTAVNIGGTTTKCSINSNYSHELASGGNNCFHDFHSYATAVNDYDARILCSLATSGVGTGQLEFISANNRFNGGISFAKGNLSAASLIQTGSASGIAQVAANSPGGAAISVSFTTAFGTAPIVNVTAWSYIGSSACGLITTVYLTTTSQFQFQVYNARSVNSGVWGYHWTAIGGY